MSRLLPSGGSTQGAQCSRWAEQWPGDASSRSSPLKQQAAFQCAALHHTPVTHVTHSPYNHAPHHPHTSHSGKTHDGNPHGEHFCDTGPSPTDSLQVPHTSSSSQEVCMRVDSNSSCLSAFRMSTHERSCSVEFFKTISVSGKLWTHKLEVLPPMFWQSF